MFPANSSASGKIGRQRDPPFVFGLRRKIHLIPVYVNTDIIGLLSCRKGISEYSASRKFEHPSRQQEKAFLFSVN